MKKITILIADDHKLIREAWAFALNNESGFSVISECGNAEDAIEKANQLRPDIVIMDINLPGMNGIDATKMVLKYAPGTKVLAVSQHTQPVYARQMMQKGAMGYVTKNSSREEMIMAIIEIYAGRKYICAEIKSAQLDQLDQGDTEKTRLNSLTFREMEVISHITNGDSSKQIAVALNLSAKTIEVHRHNILKKLNLKNSSALVDYIHNMQIEFSENWSKLSRELKIQ